ncbi:polynucleotidyl transferase, ribonuclease H fold protein with HRDC domain-containing protein isoform X2 [Tasmannia lanceolata]|uniref:polynucleotidyl transferase, ribonuclease H fold protein with HRDC domain-containing protein isoform X2 n=1 Tax=Tasmannia lanceolata TaxID=3420 RepID=UPI004062BAC4
MENKEKNIKVMIAIAFFAVISVLAATHYQNKRKQKKARNRYCSSDLENKPQNSFKRVLADNSYNPFKHFKREGTDTENSLNLHPYQDEITSLLESSSTQLNYSIRDNNSDMGDSYIWVNTRSQLEDLAEILSKELVFAVDTEQHSLRSFLGFTSLVQISTPKEDYLLDTIALHDEMGILRPTFANPSICKVFHGADNDVLWLQRDFHIYVVNLFDTAKACEVLSKPQKSLAYLLETYCGVATNKMLQREDWRLRPLSAEMVQYARANAHYLLYIADCLAGELKMKDTDDSVDPNDKFSPLLETIRRSHTVCLQLYVKDMEASPGDSAAASIFSRFSNGQGGTSWKSYETTELVRKLCAWRDLMARVHDESLRYVLSDQAIVALATEVPNTPTEIYDTILRADSNVDSSNIGPSLPSLPPVVCSHLKDICYLLEEDMGDTNDVFKQFLQNFLGPNGSCPLSIYNYPLLSKVSSKPTKRLALRQNGGNSRKQVSRKSSRELFVQKFSCKSPVYHNCRIFASDGRLLCYCDRRKIEWYLHRDLAKVVDNDPLAIMLLFEPKGRPEDEDNDFYIQSKKNMCVGCGERNHYLRYRIIPSCYRVHFPEHLKSHRSHDIVLLCVDCHEIAHSAAEKYKKQVSAEFEIPLFIRKVFDLGQHEVITETSGLVEDHEPAGVSPLQLRTAAMALLRHGPRMPSKRREELTLIVRAYFGGREVSDKDLETALLVGMSPQERRRLEKKRGLSFKYNVENGNKSNENGNIVGMTDGLCVSEDRNLPKDMCNGVRNNSANSDTVVDSSIMRKTFVTGFEENFDKIVKSEQESDWVLDTDNDNLRSRKPLNGTAASKYIQKVSLLGHGPHGKQVVEHLLKEYGEDGIRQFCQRWRQVFVEAIHPCFLPAGWDIMHR